MAARWTKQEEQFLIRNYSKMTNREIGQVLGRTRDAVRMRADKLGLGAPKKGKSRVIKREIPDHLREELRLFICEVIEGNPRVQKAMRASLESEILYY